MKPQIGMVIAFGLSLSSPAFAFTIVEENSAYMVIHDNSDSAGHGLETICNPGSPGDCADSEVISLPGRGSFVDGVVFIRDFDVWFEDGNRSELEGLDVEVSGTWNAGTETFTWNYDVHFSGDTSSDIGFTLDVVVLIGNTSTVDVFETLDASTTCSTSINSATGCSSSTGAFLIPSGGMTVLGLPAQRFGFEINTNGVDSDETVELDHLAFDLSKTVLFGGIDRHAPSCIVYGDNPGSTPTNGITCTFGSVFIAVDTSYINPLGDATLSDTGVTGIFSDTDSYTAAASDDSVFAGVLGFDFEASTTAELSDFGVACNAYAVNGSTGREFSHTGVFSDSSAYGSSSFTFDSSVICVRAVED